MQPVEAFLIFAADAGLVAWTAWLATCAAGLNRRGLIERTLGWLLLALAWIAASGSLLGLIGGLGRGGFLLVHLAVLAGWLVWRRDHHRAAAASARRWVGDWRQLITAGTAEGFITAGLGLVLLGLIVVAARAEPVVFDALTYRLSRIGAWLQDGWIRHYATDDPRLNYMPVAPDVVVAWLLGATTEGFHLAPLAQMFGGLLLLGATFGLARIAGLSRLAAFGAVALALGMANVAVQFTTIQSDLFTAGIFAASYYLWHRALLRGEGSWVAGIGVALAFGSKGTMFYLAPGAACWVGWLAWQHRDQWQAHRPTAAGLALGALVLVAPGCWKNLATYGSAFGPREAVVLHHGSFKSIAQHGDKLVRNLGTSAVQLFEPTAQPFWLQGASRSIGERLTRRLPAEADPYVFIGQSRRDQVERVMALTEPDADVVTCGLLGAGLFLAGWLFAMMRARHAAARQVFVWGAGVVVYLLVQHTLVQWHHWAFRFTVIAAPWVAVVGAWALCQLPSKLRLAGWTVLVISAADVFADVQLRANQAAWQAWTRPERAFSYYNYIHWRAWAGELDQPASPLRAAFPIDRPLAAFFRFAPPRPVELLSLSALTAPTAEAAVDLGWLVVPLERFMGHEGRVMGRTNPAFELAAYRALAPGEHPRPLLYRQHLSDVGETRRCELLVRVWSDAPLRLEMFNPGTTGCAVVAHTSLGDVSDLLPPGGRRQLEVPVPVDTLAPVTLDFSPPVAADGSRLNLIVRLAP
jgi:hypothetical protein